MKRVSLDKNLRMWYNDDMKDIEKTNKKTSLSILKSLLQKSIRRGNCELALKVAKEMMKIDKVELLRRLVVIPIEDVKLVRGIGDVFFLIKKKKWEYEDEEKVLEFVKKLILTETRYSPVFYISGLDSGKYEVDDEKIKKMIEESGFGRDLACLHYRSKMWGMESDKKMLLKAIELIWRGRLDVVNIEVDDVDINKIDELKIDDVLQCLTAVDSHCSPIVKILAKKEELGNNVLELMKSVNLPINWNVEKAIDWWMWACDGAINYRKVDELGREFDWFVDCYGFNDESREKAIALWKKYEPTIRGIQRWWVVNKFLTKEVKNGQS